VGPHAETLRPPVEHRPRRAPSTPPPRRSDEPRGRRDARAIQPADEPLADRRGPPPQADHGLALLIIFTASVLLIVVLVVLAAAVGHTWILAPIMAVDLAVTAAVLVTVANLLDDGNS
jgi:hypothetical protein